jgi:LysR family transcriptional regulator AphB
MKEQSTKSGMSRAKSGMIRRPAAALDDLTVFVCVAQQESFVEASRRLAIPTSSVSRAVARLEEDLEVQLLRRTSRRVGLTDEGRQLLLHAAVHLEGLHEALATAADRHPEPSGVVRVTAPAYTGSTRVAPALAAFAVAYPKITIELDATNTIRDLVEDGFDFGIRVGPHLDPEFVARKLWEGQFGLFASKQFTKRALRGERWIDRAALERQPCIVLRNPTKWRFLGANGGEAVEVSPTARFVLNDPRGAVEVARGGVGIVLAPMDAVDAGDPDLVELRADFGRPEPMMLYAVYPTRRLLPQRVRLAIEWLAKGGGFGEKHAKE